MAYGFDGNGGQPHSNILGAAHAGRLPFIQKVYGVLLASILVAVLAGAAVLNLGPKMAVGVSDSGQTIMATAATLMFAKMHFVVWLVLFGILFVARAVGRTPVAGMAVLFVFTALSGAWVAPNVWVVGVVRDQPGVVGLAGALTTVMFVTLSAFAMLSKRDFNYLGAGLSVAFIGLIVGGLLNAFFFHSSFASLFIAWGVLLFASGSVIYNTSRIVRDVPEDEYVFAAISLFIHLLNMFLALLRILGGGRR